MNTTAHNFKFFGYMVILLIVGVAGTFVVIEKKKAAEAKTDHVQALNEKQINTSDRPRSDYFPERELKTEVVVQNDIDPVFEEVIHETNKAKEEQLSLLSFIKIKNSCGPYFEGGCVNIRSGPGKEYGVVGALRNGQILRTSGSKEIDGQLWYQIIYDEWIRHPERITTDQYVAADFVEVFQNTGWEILENDSASSTKKIIVDRSKQILRAYDNGELYLETKVSTGLSDTPTPIGNFHVYIKTPSRYMQGPIEEQSDQYYDLPGVPWNLYFTREGAVIHGAFWHEKFGQRWSHGCVNVPIDMMEKLYTWADLGTVVEIVE